jgi:mannitol/fructose-specific phosphotransferase system IIA component (Ntr-type)
LESALLPRMLPPGFAAPAMTSKTKASILRDLVALAEQTGQLNDPAALLESLVAREEIGSTGLAGGIAVPHPCHHDPYLFESSFIVAGRTLQAVNFGAPDGRPSKLFFLICCQDDQLHLHTLARLCRMAQQTDVVIRSSSSSSSDPEAFRLGLLSAEQEALAKD